MMVWVAQPGLRRKGKLTLCDFANEDEDEEEEEKVELQVTASFSYENMHQIPIIRKTTSVGEYPHNQVGFYGEHEGEVIRC